MSSGVRSRGASGKCNRWNRWLTGRLVFVWRCVWRNPNNRYTPICHSVYRCWCHRTQRKSSPSVALFYCCHSTLMIGIRNRCRRHDWTMCSAMALDDFVAVNNRSQVSNADLQVEKEEKTVIRVWLMWMEYWMEMGGFVDWDVVGSIESAQIWCCFALFIHLFQVLGKFAFFLF